ncbi:helix-turn-helix domain-containing protein [Halobacteriales archaeon Cl-PHB]
MIDIAMDMEQYDCPYIDTSDDHDVSFSTFHWEFDPTSRELETRMVVRSDGRDQLDAGLRSLRNHDNMHDYTLLKRWDDVAHIHTVINETDAMQTIRTNDGYITGPFFIEGGSELWHVGFDSAERADKTLSDLDRNNEFAIVYREQNSLPDLQELIQNARPAMQLIEGCKELSEVERDTLRAAAAGGYFNSPRQATLGTLADEFDVSKPAVSKNLRRGEQKIVQRVVEVLDDLHPSDT